MSSIFKLYLLDLSDDQKVEKSLVGELVAPTISSFGDLIKLLEPAIYSMPSPKGDFFSIRLDVRRLDPDFDKDGNKGVSESKG